MPSADVDDWRALCVTLRFLGVGGGRGAVGDVVYLPLGEGADYRWTMKVREGVFRLVYLLLMEEEEVVEDELTLGVVDEDEDDAAEKVWGVLEYVLTWSSYGRFGRRMGQVLRAAVEARMVLAEWQRQRLERWEEEEVKDFELRGDGLGEGGEEVGIDCLYRSYVLL